jgi:poly-gamma-glutamate synthesis protein (capsule biosynthesis protein)
MYLPTLEAASGALQGLALVPMRVRRFRLQRASEEEALWLRSTLDRESRVLGTHVELASARELLVRRAGS